MRDDNKPGGHRPPLQNSGTAFNSVGGHFHIVQSLVQAERRTAFSSDQSLLC